MRRIKHSLWFGVVLLPALLGSALAAEAISYNRDIRPILAENCFACHGPDRAARKCDLRLDRRDDAITAEVLVPGKPDESEVILRLFAEDKDERMPPPASHKTLTQAQKELLRRWVAAGAEYQSHWSFLPPVRAPLPPVKNSRWARNPVDQLVLARLEGLGLEPAPEADRHTLARRVSLDLIGLPPTPQEVDAFVADPSPNAYEKFVDRLLASPHWGEHRARYWLDAARYADTHGLHFDNYREMWSYRDWVIEAFNRNLPFDRFTIEQLAGDLLPDPTLDQKIASGFNRCNISTNEGGTIPEENLMLYTRDRTETTSQVWLGLTAGCAVCHDHKFDPVSQKEFYQLSAFFNNTTQGAMDGNIKDTPPVVVVPPPPDRPRWDALAKELAEARKQVETRKQSARADFDQWLAKTQAAAVASQIPSEKLTLHAPLSEGDGSAVRFTADGKPQEIVLKSKPAWDAGHVAAKAFKQPPTGTLEVPQAGDFEKDRPFAFGVWARLAKDRLSGAVFARMDDQKGFRGWDLWVENGRVGAHVINQWPDDAIKVVATDAVKADEWNHLFVSYDGSGKAAGVMVYVNGRRQTPQVQADRLKGTIRTTVPLSVGQRHTSSRLEGLTLQDLRIYGRALSAEEVEQVFRGSRAAWILARPANQRSEADKNEIFPWWLATMDDPYRQLVARLAALEKEEAGIRARSTIAHVAQERPEPAKAHVLFRGQYDQRRDEVQPGTFACLPPMPPQVPKNRLGLAQWLVRSEHPLMASVTVNRFWQELFGTGIVRTAGDFGTTGESPTHPELLDWLAVEFRESGWDVKKLFRLLVTSATYRQSASATPEKLEKDPQNRFLSRGPRFRMDAEMVRDYALAAGGMLAAKIGGPSVKPYQPPGVWEAVAMIGSDTRDYRQDHGESLYRRSLYTFWKRAAPPASMDVFNAPSREVCTVRRERTNTPLQSLVTLNDPQFVEAARNLAQLVLKQGGPTDAARLDFLAKRLLARPLRAEETPVVQSSLKDLLAFYQSHPDQAKQLVAVGESKPDPTIPPPLLGGWTMLANELLNLDEVLNK
jgi:hypothetical protein